MGESHRYRLDDLRRLGVDLAVALGVVPARASAFVSGLLWYEAADAPDHGIGSLPDWLDAIERGEIDPKVEGKIIKEHTATAVLDAQRGLGPLVLARAALIAQEKAREIGVGVVRVVNLGWVGPVAEVVAEIALGPMTGTIAGPMTYAVAMPVEGTVPAVFDTTLAQDPVRGLPPWADEVESTWLITARAVSAFGSLAGVHEHVGTLLEGDSAPPGRGPARRLAGATARSTWSGDWC